MSFRQYRIPRGQPPPEDLTLVKKGFSFADSQRAPAYFRQATPKSKQGDATVVSRRSENKKVDSLVLSRRRPAVQIQGFTSTTKKQEETQEAQSQIELEKCESSEVPSKVFKSRYPPVDRLRINEANPNDSRQLLGDSLADLSPDAVQDALVESTSVDPSQLRVKIENNFQNKVAESEEIESVAMFESHRSSPGTLQSSRTESRAGRQVLQQLSIHFDQRQREPTSSDAPDMKNQYQTQQAEQQAQEVKLEENTPTEERPALLANRNTFLLSWVKGWAVLSPAILAVYVNLWVSEEATGGVIGLSCVGVMAEVVYAALVYLSVYKQLWQTHASAFYLIQCRVLLLVLVQNSNVTNQLLSSLPTADSLPIVHTYNLVVSHFSMFSLFFNTYLSCFAFSHTKTKVVFALATVGIFIGGNSLRQIFQEAPGRVAVFMLNLLGSAVIGSCMALFSRIIYAINEWEYQLLLSQKHEVEQYKRMVDSIREGMMVLVGGRLTFQNSAAQQIFSADDRVSTQQGQGQAREDLLDKKLIYVFNPEARGMIAKFQSNSRPSSPISRSRVPSSHDPRRPLSLREVLNMERIDQMVFTRVKDVQPLDIQNKTSAFLDQDSPDMSFDFFLIKRFASRTHSSSEFSSPQDEEIVIQIIDISSQVMLDNLNSEKQYLTYMNSTVSHEMRNPLNSLNAQVKMQKEYFKELVDLAHESTADLPKTLQDTFDNILKKVDSSLIICESSVKLLLFNVEDILALPRLKEGKLHKNVSKYCLQGSIQEIINVQQYQAQLKQVKISLVVQSPKQPQSKDTPFRVDLDEKRFQQVVLNYQSNALKFTNREDGQITIVAQVIPKIRQDTQDDFKDFESNRQFLIQQSVKMYGENLFQKRQPKTLKSQFFNLMGQDQQQSEEEEIDPFTILYPEVHEKIILTVFDNGIGIKECDKGRLYQLFGCLSSSRQYNEHGVGLGLVISKMITEEFKGQVQMFSKFQVGSIFQSSFIFYKDNSLNTLQPDNRSIIQKRMSLTPLDNVANERIPYYKKKLLETSQRQIKACIQNYQKEIQSPEKPEYNTKRILIIDDEPFNCEVLKTMICRLLKNPEDSDIVDVCYDAKQALAKLQNNITRISGAEVGARALCEYALVFTDCSMPIMDGYQCSIEMNKMFARNLLPLNQHPRIVAVTGHVESEYERRALLSGMEQIFTKPIDSDSISLILLELGFSINIPSKVKEELNELIKTSSP